MCSNRLKVTLDHNCIIDLERKNEVGKLIESAVLDDRYQCFVVNMGASEMHKNGIQPDRYDIFEKLLADVRISHLPRLNPMLQFDVTFFDRCVMADDKMIDLSKRIESILFGGSRDLDMRPNMLDSPDFDLWLNRACDVQTLWCHIHNGNDVFLTTDGNYSKETKLPKLLALGAGRICHPNDLI